MSDRKLQLTLVRQIRATPNKVFTALTTPEQIVQWWNPEGGPVLEAEVDARPKGRFRVAFQDKTGAVHESAGVYEEFITDERLVLTWRWAATPERESVVSIVLRPTAEGTELTLTHTRLHDEFDRDQTREGWSATLDQLAVLTESTIA